MTLWTALAIGSVLSASFPLVMFLRNLPLFRAGVPLALRRRPPVSVLIPARNEAAGIEAAIDAALASQGVDVEVVVLDDHSTDATPEILARKSGQDERVRFQSSRPLPGTWNGKQHACWQLADLATHDIIVFIDADVRLASDGLARLVDYREQNDVALLSAFPNQITETWLEKAIIPIMHYVLLCFLPFDQMRASHSPSFAAGCGQLFMTDKHAYQQAGTHRAIKASRHDGLKLPRTFRESGQSTDVIDGTTIATCRMYTNAGEVINGVLKNASEGIANATLILPFTTVLLGANVLPIIALIGSVLTTNILGICLSTVAISLSHLPRFIASTSLRQSLFGAAIHAPAMLLFVTLQWQAFVNHLIGRKIAWRGRA